MEIIEALRQLFQDINAGTLAVVTTGLYILINILRGKAGFDVPFITKLFNKIESKNIKTWIILGLFGVTGAVMSLNGADKITIWSILDGFLTGLTVGATTLGVRHASKSTMESKTIQKFKDKFSRSEQNDEENANNS